MLDYFLDCLHVNDISVSESSVKAIRPIDVTYLSSYDINAVFEELSRMDDKITWGSAIRNFYTRWFVATILRDKAFDNTSWGVEDKTGKPIRYIPKAPFTEKPSRYKDGDTPLTVDYIVLLRQDADAIYAIASIIVNYYSSAAKLTYPYLRQHGIDSLQEYVHLSSMIQESIEFAAFVLQTWGSHNDEFLDFVEEYKDEVTAVYFHSVTPSYDNEVISKGMQCIVDYFKAKIINEEVA